MTIGFWIAAIVVGVVGIIFSIMAWCMDDNPGGSALCILITVLIVTIIIGGGIRAMKDQQSELSNGLMREITISAEDGREIFHYVGKCDIETNGNYILFEDENGLRQMIYWGITDTIVVSELPEK